MNKNTAMMIDSANQNKTDDSEGGDDNTTPHLKDIPCAAPPSKGSGFTVFISEFLVCLLLLPFAGIAIKILFAHTIMPVASDNTDYWYSGYQFALLPLISPTLHTITIYALVVGLTSFIFYLYDTTYASVKGLIGRFIILTFIGYFLWALTLIYNDPFYGIIWTPFNQFAIILPF